MRIILIPGLGEDEKVFEHLAPLLPGDKLVLNSWTLLGDEPRGDQDALSFAAEVIARYNITSEDILIGHSMGGWIAYHIKQHLQCRTIQICSYTERNRIIAPVFDGELLYWGIRKGIIFNGFTKWFVVSIRYGGKRSQTLVRYILQKLKKGNRECIVNQMKIILRSGIKHPALQPDLRIHGKEDTILRLPRQQFIGVAGDHFTAYTHPQEVATPILSFLGNYS